MYQHCSRNCLAQEDDIFNLDFVNHGTGCYPCIPIIVVAAAVNPSVPLARIPWILRRAWSLRQRRCRILVRVAKEFVWVACG